MADSKFKIENNILKGVELPYSIKFPDLGSLILNQLESNADTVGQIDGATGETQIRGELRDQSVRCALWMKAQGIVAGDVITICSHNQLHAAIPWFATLYLAAVISPLHAGMNTNDFRHLLRIIKPKMAFANEESAVVIAEAAKAEQLDLTVVVLGEVPGFFKLADIISQPRVEDVKNFKSTPLQNPNQIATILCSSGTTGLPKGVALTHVGWLKTLFHPQMSKVGATSMTFSSLYWLSGVHALMGSAFPGAINILTPPFEEHSACKLVEKYKVKLLFLAPNMIIRLLKSDALVKYDLSSLKFVVYAGSALNDSSIAEFAKYLPNAILIGAYGMTEVIGTVAIRISSMRGNSCGNIVANAQLKVVDPTTGRTLGPNETGEFFVKTEAMFQSYYNNPEATAAAVDEEGWYHTGDLGYFDENGEIFMVDRLKEMLKYCNYQVSPAEIENVIMTHPGVKDVVVVGVPHPEDGEHPLAFVVKAKGSSVSDQEVTEKELVDLVAAQLTNAKHLRGGVRFIDSIPKTQSDKPQRKVMRDMAKSLIQQ